MTPTEEILAAIPAESEEKVLGDFPFVLVGFGILAFMILAGVIQWVIRRSANAILAEGIVDQESDYFAEVMILNEDGEDLFREEFVLPDGPLALSVGPSVSCDIYLGEAQCSVRVRIHPDGSIYQKSWFSWMPVEYGDGIDLGNGVHLSVVVEEREKEAE
jgi:hypothetical protein